MEKQFDFTYEITAEDYLTHQLFGASMNEAIKKQRKRGLILWTTAFFILAIVFYLQGNKFLSIYFIAFGIGFFLIYPIYANWIYKRYFKRYVYKHFTESNLNNMILTIDEEEIVLFNGKERGKIKISEIEKIEEIPTHIFIKLKGGRSIIIPKLKIENKEELLNCVSFLSKNNSFPYIQILKWKWNKVNYF